ncbi:hypothetical protein [Klebsiella variicola]|uniref:hypothetical protein n=1 Tax=Klebsiella variicola TaxID=244366 RepID=UPI003981EEBA
MEKHMQDKESAAGITWLALLIIAGCWLLVAGCWLLVAGCWLLVAGCWLLVAGCWLLVAGWGDLVRFLKDVKQGKATRIWVNAFVPIVVFKAPV